jgi:hypothetical protein
VEGSKNCNLIEQNSDYFFLLRSGMPDIRLGKGIYSATKNLHVNCYGFDNETTICFEDGCIRDLFYADNVKGLCYLDKK